SSPADSESDALHTAGTLPKLFETPTNSIIRLHQYLLIPSRCHIVPVSQIAVVRIVVQFVEIGVCVRIDACPERIALRLRGGDFGDRAGKARGSILALKRDRSKLVDEFVRQFAIARAARHQPYSLKVGAVVGQENVERAILAQQAE